MHTRHGAWWARQYRVKQALAGSGNARKKGKQDEISCFKRLDSSPNHLFLNHMWGWKLHQDIALHYSILTNQIPILVQYPHIYVPCFIPSQSPQKRQSKAPRPLNMTLCFPSTVYFFGFFFSLLLLLSPPPLCFVPASCGRGLSSSKRWRSIFCTFLQSIPHFARSPII